MIHRRRKKKSQIFWKTKCTEIFFIILCFSTLIKLAHIQIWQYRKYSALATEQHWQKQIIPAKRGNILASDESILATTREAYDFYLISPQFDEPAEPNLSNQELAQSLTQLLLDEEIWQIDPESEEPEKEIKNLAQTLEEKINQNGWWKIADQISPQTKEKIEDQFNGIYFQMNYKRIYPEDTLASHLLGFVGSNTQGQKQGYFGIEGYFNADLSGKNGWQSLEIDALGNPIPVGESLTTLPQNGRDIQLTINRSLQYLLETKLKEGVEKYDAKNGTFILLEPDSGNIIALANYPNFNPEKWWTTDNEDSENNDLLFSDLAISQTYEPGSVFKPLTMSIALEENIVDSQDYFNCDGPLTIQGHQIRTWNNQYHGAETMGEILQHSCNVGAAWLGGEIGFDKFWQYLEKYQLRDLSGIKLEGEATGIIKEKNSWTDIDLATASFGQGISVTPLQVINIFSVIANNGTLSPTHIVDRIIENGKDITFKQKPTQKIISPETAEQIRVMLKNVVEKGEFKWFIQQAGLSNFDIGGKTGTAQIPKNGKYDPNKTNVTFVGFMPTDKPRFVLLVKLEEPSASTYSAETAVPLWLEMVQELILHYKISPFS